MRKKGRMRSHVSKKRMDSSTTQLKEGSLSRQRIQKRRLDIGMSRITQAIAA